MADIRGWSVGHRCGRGDTHAVDPHRGSSTWAPSTPIRARSCKPIGPGHARLSTTAQISRLSKLWLDALAGICAHVRNGEGWTGAVGHRAGPAQPAPRSMSWRTAIPDRRHPAADRVTAGTPVFHSTSAQNPDDDLYVVQLDITVAGVLDEHRLRDAVQAVATRHPHLAARVLRNSSTEPVQIIPADPTAGWRYVELSTAATEEQIQAGVRGRTRSRL